MTAYVYVRLAAVGLGLWQDGECVFVDNLAFGTPAENLRREFGVHFGWEVLHVETLAERPPKQWVYLPALALLGVVGLAQARRRRPAEKGAGTPPPAADVQGSVGR